MPDKINPYYSWEILGLKMIKAFDEEYDDWRDYEYNTLCLFLTKDGQVYVAVSVGTSYKDSFEEYEGGSLKEVLQKFERVGSLVQLERICKAWESTWNKDSYGLTPLSQKDKVLRFYKTYQSEVRKKITRFSEQVL